MQYDVYLFLLMCLLFVFSNICTSHYWVVCRLYFLLSAGRAEQLQQHLIHLETQKHRLPPNHSFLWNLADPRSACLFTAQRSHSASPFRNHRRRRRRPGPARPSFCLCGGWQLSRSGMATCPQMYFCTCAFEFLWTGVSLLSVIYLVSFFSLKPVKPQM